MEAWATSDSQVEAVVEGEYSRQAAGTTEAATFGWSDPTGTILTLFTSPATFLDWRCRCWGRKND
jgi:hypothetical protein